MPAADGEAGSSSVELVLLTPLFVVLIGVTFFAGRLVLARQVVDDAARSALEAAITMPDAMKAVTVSASTAHELLGSHGLCSRVHVSDDTSSFSAGGMVSVTVTCVVRFSSLAFLRLPGAVTSSATRTGSLEPYREIGP